LPLPLCTFHASAIYLVHHYFSDRTQSRGQALYSSVSFGAGGAFGSLLSGLLFSSAGAAAPFGVSALMAGLGWVAVWIWVDRKGQF
jgi:PPP family 3-phenylpropionic acid transporter